MALETIKDVEEATSERILQELVELRNRLAVTKGELSQAQHDLREAREDARKAIRDRNRLDMAGNEIAEVLVRHCDATPDVLQERGMARYLVEWLSSTEHGSELRRLDGFLRSTYPAAVPDMGPNVVTNAINLMQTTRKGLQGLVNMVEATGPGGAADTARAAYQILDVLRLGTMQDGEGFPLRPTFPAVVALRSILTPKPREALRFLLEYTGDSEVDIHNRALAIYHRVIVTEPKAYFVLVPKEGAPEMKFKRMA